jgi:hypothetical protein
MTLDTQMSLTLLQELLMALRANDADGYKSWLALGIEELGRDVAAEVESDWMVPLLVWVIGLDAWVCEKKPQRSKFFAQLVCAMGLDSLVCG